MYIPGKSFINQLDRVELLRMRENGMSNAEIATSLGCSNSSVYKLIGAQPKEMTLANRREGRRMDGTPEARTITREHVKAEEPRKAVLAVKALPPSPIPLHGAFMDYCVSADKQYVDVETAQGRCLMQIPVDKLDLFIEELNAIKRNINASSALPFWG